LVLITLDRSQQHHACVVHHDVQRTEGVHSGLYGGVGCGFVGDVELDGEHVRAVGLELGLERGESVGAAGGDGDPSALSGQYAGRGLADAGARAGDERDLAGQCGVHVSSFVGRA